MIVTKLEEHGHNTAALGLSLSYGTTVARAKEVALKLAHRGGGENKFLRQITVAFDITAPRYWWQQMDQYKVGTCTQSASTMHTLYKRELTNADFCARLPEVVINAINKTIRCKDLEAAKWLLPESFLQRRIWTANYAVLQTIAAQRGKHKLSEWSIFLDAVRAQADHPYFIFPDEVSNDRDEG